MFNGKMKALTFSYDDGVTQDIRLIELFNKYGMKATFNINSEFLGREGHLIREEKWVNHTKVNPQEVKHIYAGHEVAVHTLTHPNLKFVETDEEVVRQVEQDRLNLSELCSYEVVGMAYPCGGDCFDERVKKLIRTQTGVKYSRTTNSTFNFDLQTDLVEFNPSVYHHVEMDQMFKLGEEFLKLQTDKPQIYYVWGHAYEFDIHNNWDRFEEFLQMMSGRYDICYCTTPEAILAAGR